MIHELFTNVVKAADILDVDREFRAEVLRTRGRLPSPTTIPPVRPSAPKASSLMKLGFFNRTV